MASARKRARISAAAAAHEPTLTDDFADLMRAIRNLVGHYHPEQHYMRGPGPAWHAKHDPAPADVSAVHALVRVKA
jgi:hypothetical protein